MDIITTDTEFNNFKSFEVCKTLPVDSTTLVDYPSSGPQRYATLVHVLNPNVISLSGDLTIDNVSISNFPEVQAVSGPLTHDEIASTTLGISATSLPLPTGASTAALQQTVISTLTSGSQVSQVTNTVLVSANSNLPITIVGPLDSFGKVRVAQADTILESKLTHDSATLFWDTSATANASAIYDALNSCMVMTVSAANTRVVRQTRQRLNYEAGKSLHEILTFVMGTGTTSIRRAGYFDDLNGTFFELSGTQLSFVVRKNGVDVERATQSSWNVDTLSGTGPSRYNIDISKAQIYSMDLQWLGVGTIRHGFITDDCEVVAHHFHHVNSVTNTYMTKPNLPIRYEIIGTSSTVESMRQICATVMVEGGIGTAGATSSMATPIAGVTTNSGAIRAVLGVRLRQGYQDISGLSEQISIALTSGQNAIWYWVMNPTLTTPATVWTAAANAPYEYSISSSNNTVTDVGYVMDTSIVSSSSRQSVTGGSSRLLRLGSSIAGESDQAWICIETTGNTSTIASITFKYSI